MSADPSLPAGVELVRALADQQPVLANLLELYAHDFSEFTDLRLGPDGRFGYPGLSRFLEREDRFAFLVKVEGHLGGMVMIARGSVVSGDPEVWDVAEFFIARRYRKRGIGAAVAHEVWRRFPGRWEVRVLEANVPARAFWRSAVSSFARSGTAGEVCEWRGKRWEMFSFISPAR